MGSPKAAAKCGNKVPILKLDKEVVEKAVREYLHAEHPANSVEIYDEAIPIQWDRDGNAYLEIPETDTRP